MAFRRSIALLAIAVLGACSSDETAAPPPPPAPVATTIAISAGADQSAAIGTAVTTAPAVIVKDQFGKPFAGAPVTFAVSTGGGSVTGATVTTGTNGIATLGGWTLGIQAAAQTLTATSGSLSTTFTATGVVPSGCNVVNYALGVSLPMTWDTNDCTVASTVSNGWGTEPVGKRYDRLQFTTTQQQQVDALVTGADGRQLLLRDSRGLYVGLQPNAQFSPVAQNPMHIKYVLAPGTYTFNTATSTKVDCNYVVFASTNVTVSDSVVNKTYNCTGPTGFMEQWVNLQLRTGMKIRLTLTADFPALFIFRDDRQGPASPSLVTKQGSANQTLVIDWTATFDKWHEIVIAPLNAAGGKYTLKIEELP
jgi:hypothetical protein